ncbi:hypothetical protein A4G86_24930 [Burkholderia pseudomallei]|nr:hypothetical protein A4G86_24930 [Burkholderia pseudomallei]
MNDGRARQWGAAHDAGERGRCGAVCARGGAVTAFAARRAFPGDGVHAPRAGGDGAWRRRGRRGRRAARRKDRVRAGDRAVA